MKTLKILIAVLMLGIFETIQAQYPTNGVPATWKNVLGDNNFDYIDNFVHL